MKKFFCILTAMLLLSLSGCGITTYYWEFQYSVDNVKEIKIVDIQKVGGAVDNEEDYTILKIVDEADYADIMDDIQIIGYYYPFVGSNPINANGPSIIIVFESGEYDVISATDEQLANNDKLPHWELAKKYNLIDFDLGVKISGAGFPV